MKIPNPALHRLAASLLALPFILIVCAWTMAACSAQPEPIPTPAEVTRAVPVTVEVVATRLVPVTVEVEATRLVPVTVPVEVTRVTPATVVVEVTRVVAPTPVPVASLPAATAKPAPQRPATLAPGDVVAAFKAAGLEAEQPVAMTKDDYGFAPLVGEGVRFLVPSICPDCGGRVFVVSNKDERDRLRGYYEELAKGSAMLFSWVFERGDVIVQINGDLPEEQARKYEAVIQALP